MDGWVSIGTELNTKQLEKDIKEAERKLKTFENESEKLTKRKAKLEIDTKTSEKNIEILNKKIEQARQKMKQEKKELSTFANWQKESPEYQKQVEAVEKVKISYAELLAKHQLALDKIKNQEQEFENIDKKIKENTNQQEILNNQLDEMNVKLKKSKGLDNIKDSINAASNSMTGIIKKVGKWALAIFSVRSAYMFIRSAISTVSQYNTQIATDIEYIKYALAMTLQPVIEGIINLAYKLLAYINYIAKAWFRVNLFAKASADNFTKVKEGISGASKEAKKLNKQLAGFDEMNVLQEDGSTALGGGGGGASIEVPSVDLSKIDNVKIPKWLQQIEDHKDEVLGFFKTLAVVIGAVKLAKLLNDLGLLKPLLGLISKGFSGLLGVLKNLITGGINGIISAFKGLSALQIAGVIAGVVIAISGLVMTIKAVIAFIKDPSWAGFNQILLGLTITLGGVALAMLAFNATNPVGWIMAAVTAVLAIVTALSTLVSKLFEDKAQILDTKDAQEQLTEAINNTKTATNDYINAVDNAEEAEKRLAEAEKNTGLSGEDLFKKVQDGTLDYKNMTDQQKEVYKAYLNNKDAQDKLKESTEKLTDAKKKEKDASFENQLAIGKEKGNYDDFKKSIVEAYEKGELKAGEARDYIERAMSDMSNSSAKTFQKDLPGDIKDGLDPKHYQNAFTKLKNGFSDLWGDIKSGASSAWGKVKSIFGFSHGGVVFNPTGFAKGGVVGFANGGLAKPVKCARGSIISQPGRGVPIGRAIGGEAGAEGIIPLTDSQMMSQLGEAIGRYININLTNITKLDNRQIAKEQRRINAQNDFVLNR